MNTSITFSARKMVLTILILSIPSGVDASLLWSAISDDVSHLSPTELDNIAPGTVLVWWRPKSVGNAALRGIVSKYNNISAGWEFSQLSAGTAFHFRQRYGTTHDRASSTLGVMSADTWQFIGATWATADSVPPSIYYGNLLSLVRDVTDTATDTTDAGTLTSDAANNLVIGNHTTATDFAPNADIAWVGIWRRKLTLGEIREQQFNPHPTFGNVLFSHYGYNGTTDVPDWSGQRNPGTINGPRLAPHVPLRSPFGW